MQNNTTTASPAGTQPTQVLDDWFLDLLECPGCEHHLPVTLVESSLVCACGRYRFPIRDGIPILLVEEATIIDETANPAEFANTATNTRSEQSS